jgi:hypothetical protein
MLASLELGVIDEFRIRPLSSLIRFSSTLTHSANDELFLLGFSASHCAFSFAAKY